MRKDQTKTLRFLFLFLQSFFFFMFGNDEDDRGGVFDLEINL